MNVLQVNAKISLRVRVMICTGVIYSFIVRAFLIKSRGWFNDLLVDVGLKALQLNAIVNRLTADQL